MPGDNDNSKEPNFRELPGFYAWAIDPETNEFHRVFITQKVPAEYYEQNYLRYRKVHEDTIAVPEDISGKVNYAFLSDFENHVLTMKGQGRRVKEIARALSGGHSRMSCNANKIAYTLKKARKKIRERIKEYENE